MRIIKQENNDRIVGYTLQLTANETYQWAHRPGVAWPASTLSGSRVRVDVDSNGLYDLAIDGRERDCDSTELSAMVADHLPPEYRHLWPTWEFSAKH